MSEVADPGPEAVDKILDGLEDFKWSPTDVARQARRLRAHIVALRALEYEKRALKALTDYFAAYNPNERLREAAQAVVNARVGLVSGYRSAPLDDALNDLDEALSPLPQGED